MSSTVIDSIEQPDSGRAAPGGARERQVSEFTELTKMVQKAGLLRRRYAYYWTRFAVVLLPVSYTHLTLPTNREV